LRVCAFLGDLGQRLELLDELLRMWAALPGRRSESITRPRTGTRKPNGVRTGRNYDVGE
jgi:hypothetical protein